MEEQRKAAIDKAAIALCAESFQRIRPELVAGLQPEAIWQQLAESSKATQRTHAQTALEAVGYFGLVEAAEAVVKTYGKYEQHEGSPQRRTTYWSTAAIIMDIEELDALNAALKEVR